MTESNRHILDYHDSHGGVGTSGNVVMPNDFLDISVDDYEQPCGESIMFNVEGTNDHPSRWESQNTQFVNDPSQAGTSGVHNQSSGQNAGYFDPENTAFENPTQFLEREVPPKQYQCTCCQVLREIIHCKGEEETAKLEIHGRLGIICHGILEIRSGDMTAPIKDYRVFDFCKKSISDVRQFLVKYFEDRTEAFYTKVKDPLITFYEALCVRSDWDLVFDDIPQEPLGNIGTDQAEAQSDETRPRKKSINEQREMVKKLKVKDFVPYFHLRQDEAAKRLGVSSSVIKKVCRKERLKRWPFRKMEAIERRIRDKISSMDTADAKERAEAKEEIERLQKTKADIYAPYK